MLNRAGLSTPVANLTWAWYMPDQTGEVTSSAYPAAEGSIMPDTSVT